MRNIKLPLFCFNVCFWYSCLTGICQVGDNPVSINRQIDMSLPGTDKEDQILYNGRAWRNNYYRVKEDQFLFSNALLSGSVSMEGITFNNISLLYDIYTDEIITRTSKGVFLQLNKEMVDSFSFDFENRKRYFTRTNIDTIRGFKGYLNVLYTGKLSLYAKYKKEIELLAVDRKYDLFYQTHKIFLVKDSIIYNVSGRRELLKLLYDEKIAVKTFIKKNKLLVTFKKPESFIPVIRFYDSLK
jgi:hypothetical protein